jgi:hypothetical protein
MLPAKYYCYLRSHVSYNSRRKDISITIHSFTVIADCHFTSCLIRLSYLCCAQYLRLEEVKGLGGAGVEAALSSLHEGILGACPALLPSLRRLTAELHSDRARALQQRAELMGALTVCGGGGGNGMRQRGGTRSGAAYYSNLSKISRHSGN